MSGATDDRPTLLEVLPKAGLVYSEKGNLNEVLCKPKIMPIKSVSLERLEAMEQQAENFRGRATRQLRCPSENAWLVTTQGHA